MSRIPRWCRWLLGGFTLVTAVGAVMLVPAIQQARESAKKSKDK